jgi:2-haloacid dehalogenase
VSIKTKVILFDVNETLSDMSPMSTRFAEVGAPGLLVKVWFAGLLRDGFALTAAGESEKFSVIATESLREALTGLPLNRSAQEALDYIMDGFANLGLHSDVVGAIGALQAAGFRLATLSNGSTQVAERLFRTSGIREKFEVLLSVEEAPGWKPLRGAYQYAVDTCEVDKYCSLPCTLGIFTELLAPDYAPPGSIAPVPLTPDISAHQK